MEMKNKENKNMYKIFSLSLYVLPLKMLLSMMYLMISFCALSLSIYRLNKCWAEILGRFVDSNAGLIATIEEMSRHCNICLCLQALLCIVAKIDVVVL